MLPDVDATHDVGTTSLRFRDLNISRNAVIGGTLGVTGTTTFSSDVVYGAGFHYTYVASTTGTNTVTSTWSVPTGVTKKTP